jgi:hypothetical protein
MRVIVIDIENKKVYETHIGTDYREIYPLIGNGCHTFCCPVTLPNGDTMFADDEALLQPEIKGGFIMEDWNYPICGNAVLMNSDDEGESVDALSDVEELSKQIYWVNKEAANKWAEIAVSRPPLIITSND